MIQAQTVFVVGAGASVGFGLPLGNTLTTNISKTLAQIGVDPGYPKLAAPPVWHGAISRSAHGEVNDYLAAARAISRDVELRASIDEYLRLNRDNPLIVQLGKMAIFECILKGERVARRKLLTGAGQDTRLNMSEIRHSWYWPLWNAMSEDCEKSKPEDVLRNVTFIIFNYDRCIELFLSQAIWQTFDVPLEDAALMVARRAIHPYGDLGPVAGHDAMDFGLEDDQRLRLEHGASRLRTFFETKDTNIETSIHREMIKARNIFFVGFGFHRQNMELLQTSPGENEDVQPMPNRQTRVYATMVDTSAEQRSRFQQRIRETIWPGHDQVYFEPPHADLSAAQVINDAHFTLTEEAARLRAG